MTLQQKALEQSLRILDGFNTSKILGIINYTLSNKKVGDEAIKAVLDAVSPGLFELNDLVIEARGWIQSVIKNMEGESL